MSEHRCPTHGFVLLCMRTRYGLRYECPDPDCTVAMWSGATSTPADAVTRKARQRAHAALDPIWKSGRCSRGELYDELSNFLGLSREETHIGKFDSETCARVVEFAENLARGVPRKEIT